MAKSITRNGSVAQELLKLIDACDDFPYSPSTAYSDQVNKYWLFALLDDWTAECKTLRTVGYMLDLVIDGMPWTSDFQVERSKRILSIPFHSSKSESQILEQQLQIAREQKSFKVLGNWHNELYPILDLKGRLVEFERAASGLFGIATRGVHCTAYMQTADAGMKLIIPRRAANKSTYPSMLDNAIAGGMASGESPWLAILRETEEETGISPFISSRAIAVGTISYIHLRDERARGETGLFMPECQYVYDLELREGIEEETPRVHDDNHEVSNFEYMSLQQTWDCLLRDEFKPNCGLVLIDFFLRRGYIRAGRDHWLTEEEDVPAPQQQEHEGIWEVSAEEYSELVTRLHRKLVFESVDARLG